jgi:OOP family OmpA-OmpF porin
MLPIARFAITFLILCAGCAMASPFKDGWELQSNASSLVFDARVIGSEAAVSFFADADGEIAPDGTTEIAVSLESIDSGDALRDARVRFLLLESFRMPQARVTARIEPGRLAGLGTGARAQITQTLTLELNGVSREIETTMDIVVISETVVSVASVDPIRVELADFDLMTGLEKLVARAGVDIRPQAEVSFEFLFKAVAPPASEEHSSRAKLRACVRQIDAIAKSDQVYFTSGSVRLETKSYPLLNAVADTLRACPGLTLRIEGHTDNRGPGDLNQRLSVGRAAEVIIYLVSKGIDPARLNATGFGESRPIADNATRRGRWQNRRIEFVALEP